MDCGGPRIGDTLEGVLTLDTQEEIHKPVIYTDLFFLFTDAAVIPIGELIEFCPKLYIL